MILNNMKYIAEVRRMEIEKEQELLRIALLKERELESTLVHRLRQLEPYNRRSFYLDEDTVMTPSRN